jgi:tetratricopeptide (TPR) repeat protein
LVNDFPTTEREHQTFHHETAATEEKLRELGEELLKAGKELTPEEKERLDALVAQKTKEDAEKGVSDLGELARAEAKRKKGNEEFKGGNVPQAVVHYTESILIKADPSALANRAACFLKMHEYDKVLADCEACIALDAAYVKAHFRRGLALMELHRYGEAGVAFAKTLELEPNNKQAKASITMAQQKAHFQKMKAQKK